MKPSETSGGFFLQKSFLFLWRIEKHFYLWDMNNTQTLNTMYDFSNDSTESLQKTLQAFQTGLKLGTIRGREWRTNARATVYHIQDELDRRTNQ